MRILSCCPRGYYGQPEGISYEYISFVEMPRALGHEVHHFDHMLLASNQREYVNEFFLSIVKRGSYDLVLIMTFADEFLPEVLNEIRNYTVTLAWNCDDDWRWSDYSSKWVQNYTYMATTYRHIYNDNKANHPNLILSQWACTGYCDGSGIAKDINISFVGNLFGQRFNNVVRLRKELGLVAYGKRVPLPGWQIRIKRRIARLLRIQMQEPSLELKDQNAVKDIWNRSRILFTPLEGGISGALQIKARVFDQGLSGGLMLCDYNEALHEFYEPMKEYVEFENMDDCVEKAHYYLKHETARQQITQAYYKRTTAQHLWEHRFEKLFQEIGLP